MGGKRQNKRKKHASVRHSGQNRGSIVWFGTARARGASSDSGKKSKPEEGKEESSGGREFTSTQIHHIARLIFAANAQASHWAYHQSSSIKGRKKSRAKKRTSFPNFSSHLILAEVIGTAHRKKESQYFGKGRGRSKEISSLPASFKGGPF